MNDDQLAAQVQTKIMELQKFGANIRVTPEFVSSAGVEVAAEHIYGQLSATMKTTLLSDKVGSDTANVWCEHRETVTVTIPVATRYKRWGFWPSVRIVDTDVEVEADFAGTVAVTAEMFNIFPEARPEGYYPNQWGRQRQFYRFSQDFS